MCAIARQPHVTRSMILGRVSRKRCQALARTSAAEVPRAVTVALCQCTACCMMWHQNDGGAPEDVRIAVAFVSMTRISDSAMGLRSWS